MPHGWLILDKPRGMGSTQAVAAVKRNLREAGFNMKLKGGLKVGHGGTLDPLAEGVLPIALGEATKLSGRMLDSDKTYEFTVQFGEETDTLDAEGQVVARSDRRPPRAAIPVACDYFTGEIDQVPPRYSALKVDGRRAYDLARAGDEVELATRRVTIHSLAMVGRAPDDALYSTFASTASRPDAEIGYEALEMAEAVTLVAHVSKGTYIRSLARDLAHALGTVGHVTYLRRIKAGPFTQEQAISLDILNEIGKGAPLQDHLLPLEAGLDGIPALALDPEVAQAVRQGRVVSGLPHPDGLHFATLEQVPVALVELDGGTMTVVRGFNC
jgi:tRNA pseudouridine55 synthase